MKGLTKLKRIVERRFVGDVMMEAIEGDIPVEPEWWWDILAEYFTA